MNANELADAMEIRASIRRKATSRKSVTEGANDRLADQLDQAATMLRQQEVEIERITSKHEEMLKEMLEKTNEPVAWINEVTFQYLTELGYPAKVYPKRSDGDIPLYTQQRPHNTVLVPCDKLAEMQAEIKDLKQQVAFLEDWRDTWSPFLKAITGKVNEE